MFEQLYSSKRFVLAALVPFAFWWLRLVPIGLAIVEICFISILNLSLLRYKVVHSFDLYMHGLGQVVVSVCEALLRRSSMHQARDVVYNINSGLMGAMAVLIAHSLDGHRCAGWVKASVYTLFLFLTAIRMSRYGETGFASGWEGKGFQDLHIALPLIAQSMSVLHIRRVALMNNALLFFKRVVFQLKYRNCILIAMYPNLAWMNDGVREKLTMSLEKAFDRELTLSLDIYKQAVQQQIDVYLDHNRDVSHLFLRYVVACKINQVESRVYEHSALEITYSNQQMIAQYHFSQFNVCLELTIFLAVVLSSYFEIWDLTIIYELFCIVLLSIGVLSFNIKMIKYYLANFDFYWKLLNWTLFVIADAMWNHHEVDMAAARFIAYILRQIILTIVVLHIICIDAYHLTYRSKFRATVLISVMIMYWWFCVASQVYVFDPMIGWRDVEIRVVWGISMSLQAVMSGTLINFILFILKQLILMKLHPNEAFIEVYPSIQWVD